MTVCRVCRAEEFEAGVLPDLCKPCETRVFAEQAQRAPAAPVEGAGDKIARLTAAMGIKPCEGCKKRREAMNLVSAADQKDQLAKARAMMNAIWNPEKVLKDK